MLTTVFEELVVMVGVFCLDGFTCGKKQRCSCVVITVEISFATRLLSLSCLKCLAIFGGVPSTIDLAVNFIIMTGETFESTIWVFGM